jgi:hypothetical protein
MSNWLVGELGGEMFDWLTNAEKQKIVKQALEELRIHSTLEEELFYPAVREQLKNGIMNEADEEHHVAKVLIAELDGMNADNDHFDAKFTVLSESVRHHIKEEEDQMLPKARDLKIDFQALGEKMERRKDELKSKGLPPTSEDAMIRKMHGGGDSPARVAHRVAKKRVAVKRSSTARRG